ncbi:FAD-binding oxidoreductase [Rhodovarius crocodyli]|uniref:FAD-binding oxidoreductase n=1 Tax=Rhodovarius crocodyli TaxID=1979269 RepID=A0A437MIP6_9PROT|nr:FAD-binding oxidoreductase [Rhodovarius crocodyli]RVT97515.1 FAD-binding oxidoreductase [Rhodovarius crocodyli]
MSHVVIIGAGIVGAATAIEALKRGFQVTILDPGTPGGEQAASYGNGCWLNPLSVIPPALPGLWKKVPKFLMDPLGPLAIRWSYFPKVMPWLARYLWAGWTEDKVRGTARALRGLLQDGPARHLALAREAGVEHLIERKGLMYVYADRAQFQSEGLAWKLRGEVGCTWRELGEDELRQREPELARRYTFGILTEEGASCSDPGAYVAAVVAHAQALGARFVQAGATGFRIEGGRLKAVLTTQGEIAADKAIIAAGARSKALATAAGETLRIESERGYHAEISTPEVEPRTPMMPFDGKMSVIRTKNGLRCAGQVEIAGVDAEPNWKRAEILRDHLLRMLPGLPADMPAERVKVWLGHRPSMPDGLPCIGPAKGCADVILNAGHGHVGLAGGPASAALAAAFLLGENPPGAAAFSPRRFD